jgi:hypothetical protein
MIRIIAALTVTALLLPLGDFPHSGYISTAIFTIPATVIVGFPTYLYLHKRGRVYWWHCAGGGAFIGAIFAAPFVLGGAELLLGFAGAFAIIGMAHGILFWFLGVFRNPINEV